MTLPEPPSPFRSPTPAERPWWWRLEDAAGVHLDAPFAERRVRLEAAAASWQPPFFLTPATADVEEARGWFEGRMPQAS